MPQYVADDFAQQLSAFSPGFWFFDGEHFKLDTQMRNLWQVEENELSLETFLAGIDAKGANFLRRFFFTFHEELLTIKFATAKEDRKEILMQGSVLSREEDGRVSCCSGYCIELKTQFSIPRVLHSHELGMWEWNGISGECHFCEDYRRMLGYGPDDAFPQTFEEWITLVHPEDLDVVDFQRKLAVYPEFGDNFECSIRLRHKNGHYIWTIGKGFVSQRNHLGHAVSLHGTNQNIEIMRKKYEESLQEVMRDSLTNCYSRDFFKNKWNEVLRRDAYPLSFLYIDICGLKMINDLLGHDVGDKVIVTAVGIIERTIQMPKFVIRMGGDEFLVVLPNCTSELASECMKNLKKVVALRADTDIPVLFSIGHSSMIFKSPLRESIQSAEREMQRNKEVAREEDRLLLNAFVERTKGEKVHYTDSRLQDTQGDA
ncbi:MAG TPA: sensor domain-containing diguanylate cyclase [Candidatus Desulfovibrio intestinavium]|uniref:diguanylate cyclase n=1 Tax=Candidatus Desulfovibrio intestinavium TaxID=2838534 RepID=A0A9D2HQQ6_9BACT|nr:sensor domain-containing diguanylate cyclase [Candidatus Desulfovibrio intestinavium]